jgi:hypothetical protein
VPKNRLHWIAEQVRVFITRQACVDR